MGLATQTVRSSVELLLTFSPELQLHTLFVLDEQGRIISTREPNPTPGPRFALIRGVTHCFWAIRADLGEKLTAQVHMLAREEPPTRDFQSEPLHAKRYISLIGGDVHAGPAFTFRAGMLWAPDVLAINELSPLERHFRGWRENEIPECSPILAVMEQGAAISVCFCARRSAAAAEAGVETAERFRGRGLGSRVTAAWARAIEATDRLPIYSTSWNNGPSLSVARKLSLSMCASDWSLSE